jgi:hypothetical protein
MTYKVKIIETLSRIVEVEANSSDEAWDKVEAQWKASEIVLDSGDFEGHEIYVVHGNENQ